MVSHLCTAMCFALVIAVSLCTSVCLSRTFLGTDSPNRVFSFMDTWSLRAGIGEEGGGRVALPRGPGFTHNGTPLWPVSGLELRCFVR